MKRIRKRDGLIVRQVIVSLGIMLQAMVAASVSVSEETDGAIEASDRQLAVEPISAMQGRVFSSSDSLSPGDEASEDARQCLRGLCWEPRDFQVHCQKVAAGSHGDLLVRFPSAIPSGNEANDLVAMEWYIARKADGQPRTARTVVVVHESGSGMKVGRLFAKGLRLQGLHALMIHLPYYGERATEAKRPRDAKLIPMMHQAIADVRRARDATAVLPWVDASHIALQGTSLGGFVSATAAGLDDGYDSVHLMLAGGRLYELLQNGKKDAARVREQLAAAGISGASLKSLAWQIEPTRLAHRVNPQATWLFSGTFDTVVPPENASALADAARLDEMHHVRLPANHYSGIIYLPIVLDHIRTTVNDQHLNREP